MQASTSLVLSAMFLASSSVIGSLAGSGATSGATGAVAVIFLGLIINLKEAIPGITPETILHYVFATVIIAGAIQILAGFLRLGKFIRLVPHPVMFGFVNGLAIVIFKSQLGMFKIGGEYMPTLDMIIMLGLVGLTMAIMYGLPKLTDKIPAGLTAILVVTGLNASIST